MVNTSYRFGLNPIVTQAMTNLQYRYSDERPKMYGVPYNSKACCKNNMSLVVKQHLTCYKTTSHLLFYNK